MKQLALTLVGLLLISGPIFGFADVTQVGVSARPLGMGKAFLGFSDDASCILLNPAGVGKIDSLKVTSMSGTLLSEIGLLSLGVAYPTEMGTFGGSFVSSSLPGINLTRIVGGTIEVLGQTDYSNSAMILTYATGLSRFEFIPNIFGSFIKTEDLTVGANLKLYNQMFTNQSGSLEGAQGSGMDMDFALLYEMTDDITLGASLLNGLPSGLGGQFIWQKNSEVEGIPAILKIGGVASPYEWISLAVDVDMWVTAKNPSAWHIGIEHTPIDVLSLRLGIDQQSGPVSVDNNISLGVGFKYSEFTFDYAYHTYGELAENTTHYLSLGYIGPEKKKVVKAPEDKAPEAAREAAKPAAVKPAPPLKRFSDVKEGFWANIPIVYLATLDIISGYPDSTFKPSKPLTRAELTALLVRAKEGDLSRRNGLRLAQTLRFKDVKSTYWAAPYISKAVELGYVSGYPDGSFKPNNPLTLAEAVKVFAIFDELKMPEAIYTSPARGLSPLHWAARYAYVAKQAGMLDYLGGKTFEPSKKFTRAEAAYMLSRTKFGRQKIEEVFGETL